MKGRVFPVLRDLVMGCSLEAYRARVGMWHARGVQARRTLQCLCVQSGLTNLWFIALVIAMLLIIGGIELNPGPVSFATASVHGSEPAVVIKCFKCSKIFKNGIMCCMCESWFHFGCVKVKKEDCDVHNWFCKTCDTPEYLREQIKSRDLIIQELKAKLQESEDTVKEVTERFPTRNDTVVNGLTNLREKTEMDDVLIMGDSMIRWSGDIATKTGKGVQIYPGIKIDQLAQQVERVNEEESEKVRVLLLHVGTNDLKKRARADYIMGELYELGMKAKSKFRNAKIVMSGIVRRDDVPLWRVKSVNDRMDWVCAQLGLVYVDADCWIGDRDFSRDGLHLNRRGAFSLGKLHERVIYSCRRS